MTKSGTERRTLFERLRRFIAGPGPVWMGLALILAYWVHIRPASSPQGYVEDLCSADQNRQMMADNLRDFGEPRFTTQSMMAPTGASVPFMSWSLERDWIGGYLWLLDRTFPFLWIYVGLSFVVAYLGVGYFLRRMLLPPWFAWGLSALCVAFNVPRHFKVWHHFEHLPQHWIYLGIFLDAWIWQRLWRDNRWSWSLELWRFFCFLGVFAIAGYFWGPMTLEWVVVRAAVLCLAAFQWRKGKLVIDGNRKSAAWAGTAAVVLLALELRWLVPLVREARKFPEVFQPVSWFADLVSVARPLWADPVYAFFKSVAPAAVPQLSLRPVDWSETVVVVGWIFWVPALLGTVLFVRKHGWRGMLAAAPFLTMIVMALLYLGERPWFHAVLQTAIPFFKFFRVASRWGLILPALLGAVIALSWPEISAWARGRRKWLPVFILFGLLSFLELGWILHPVRSMPPMPDSLSNLLAGVRVLPGTTVLDMPFCVVGGNAYCGGPGYGQCPNYPEATAGACLREWHDKKVLGLYQARMTDVHCRIFDRPPYQSWFQAWKEQRCFELVEWEQFCAYLGEHREISAILLYPDIWVGALKPGCFEKFQQLLGPPRDQAWFFSNAIRGGRGVNPTRVFWFEPRCDLSKLKTPVLPSPAPLPPWVAGGP